MRATRAPDIASLSENRVAARGRSYNKQRT